MLRSMSRLLLVPVLIYIGITGWMLAFEDSHIYFPDAEMLHTPADAGLPFTQHRFDTPDGVSLYAWWMPAPGSRYAVLHFHGNMGNISHRLHLYKRWHTMGLSVFAVEYRGFGKSSGQPSEDGLYEDARAGWRYLTGMLGIPPAQVIIVGRSLGCAIAADLAGKVRPAGTVLETPFTSIPDMAGYIYPWLPLSLLARTQLNTLAKVRNVHHPLLLINARDDRVVPPAMTEDIFAAAHEPKTLRTLAGGHNNFGTVSEKAYFKVWEQWLATIPE